jgi:hypothetical protein
MEESALTSEFVSPKPALTTENLKKEAGALKNNANFIATTLTVT